MSITTDMMGGRWEQAWRSLKVDTEGWIRGGHIPDGIYRLQKYAKWADESPSEATYRALLQAIVKLQDEITRYSHRLRKFAVATERLYEYVDTERRNLVAEAPADPAPWDQDDDELLDRMAALYGLPKTRKDRR